MNSFYKKKSRENGIGLIEVLIAVVIFALGIISLLKLQSALLKASSLAQNRSIAVQLAEAKVEDLRGFTDYDSTDTTVFDFTSIISNSGGVLTATGSNCTDNSATAQTLTMGNAKYSRNWCVTNYYYNGTTLTNTAPSSTALIAQKAITVHIGWTDTDSTVQLLTYNVLINKNGEITGGDMAQYAGGSGEKPIVPHAGSTLDRVTPVSVGTDTKRETLVPNSTAIDGFVSTSFQSHVYTNSGELLRTEEFKNVACACAFDGLSTETDMTRAPSYPKWDPERGTYRDQIGPLVADKPKGCVDDNENGNCDSNPNFYCEICCRDHHDVRNTDTTVARRNYDPYFSKGDINSTYGTAKKFKGTATEVTSGTYYDSCRLKRIDGYWRVFQDWNMVNFTALPITDLQDSTTKSAYSQYVKDVVDAIIGLSGNATDGSGFTPPTFPSDLSHTTPSTRVSLAIGGTKESSARSIYVDYIDSDFLTAIRAKKSTGQDYLLHVPFYELDTTSVAKWQSSNTSSVSVVSSSADSIAASAGRITGVANNTSPVGIGATLRLSNSGLTDLSVNIDYKTSSVADATTMTSSYEVCIGCSGGSTGASCTGATGGTLLDGASRPVYSATSSSDCNTVKGTITCNNGTLTGATSYLYASCTTSGATCTSTITAITNQTDDVISAISGSNTVSCPYSSTTGGNKYYSCPGLNTSLGAAITVNRTKSNGQTSTLSLTSNCGTQTANF